MATNVKCVAWITNDMQTNNIFWLSVIKHKILYFNLYIIRTNGRSTPFSSIHTSICKYWLRVECVFHFRHLLCRCHESFDKNFSFPIYLYGSELCVFCLFCDTFLRRCVCVQVWHLVARSSQLVRSQCFARWRCPASSRHLNILSQREFSLQNANRSRTVSIAVVECCL